MQATTHPPSPMHGAEYHDAHDSASRGATWLIAGATERLALCRAWNKRDRKSELDHLVTCPQLFKSCPESWGQSKLPTGEVSRSFGIHSTLLRTFLFTPWRGGALCLGLQATDMHAHACIPTAWSFNQCACMCMVCVYSLKFLLINIHRREEETPLLRNNKALWMGGEDAKATGTGGIRSSQWPT